VRRDIIVIPLSASSRTSDSTSRQLRVEPLVISSISISFGSIASRTMRHAVAAAAQAVGELLCLLLEPDSPEGVAAACLGLVARRARRLRARA